MGAKRVRPARVVACVGPLLALWMLLVLLGVRPHLERTHLRAVIDHPAEVAQALRENFARKFFFSAANPPTKNLLPKNPVITTTTRAPATIPPPPPPGQRRRLPPPRLADNSTAATTTTSTSGRPIEKPPPPPSPPPRPSSKKGAGPPPRTAAAARYASHDEAAGAPRGTLTCDGRFVDSELIYWRDVPADRALERAPYKRPGGEEQFLTFEYDAGGWNNIRMGVECMLVFAHVTGRTIVLPPAQQLYLVSKEFEKRRAFGLAAFLNVTLLSSHRGWKTRPMPEFLADVVRSKGVEPPAQSKGPALWGFMKRNADAMLPPVTRKFFVFPDGDLADDSIINTTTTHLRHGKQQPGRRSSRFARRLDAFAQGRQPLFYDQGLRAARHLHAADPRAAAFYRRFVRDYARYRDEIQCAADKVVRAIRDRNGTYYAIHARRNDFQYRTAKIGAQEIIDNLGGYDIIPRGALVYLATDDPKGKCQGCINGCPDDPSWDPFARHGWTVLVLDDFRSTLLPDLNPNHFGMVDQLVCSRAKVFAGTFWSTFSGFIHRLRGYHGLGEASYYHTKGRVHSLRDPRRMGPGWMREWRSGWSDDERGYQS
ncbi:hypothetical protein CTAYLR_001779 [Chrysophaeum taylorii]|uniref:O-fucosyltransferase family protein n=1 Tax=Chrysophaeum taylorii TaxID=2483200 RepID=A0AAD7UET3_9STRA|nr:hypothetical protein CTAYLR_001779 [Chrysophaeum taylorii]